MGDEIDLSKAKTEDLICELDERGELPQSDINDFSNAELRQALGITEVIKQPSISNNTLKQQEKLLKESN